MCNTPQNYEWEVVFSRQIKDEEIYCVRTIVIAPTLDIGKEIAIGDPANTGLQFESITRTDLNQFFPQDGESQEELLDNELVEEDENELTIKIGLPNS